ncbi:MAG: flagellar protein FlaG [Stagnimonas sp.]|nr:flagellar protein FlaG [Stagnimonas sp.]
MSTELSSITPNTYATAAVKPAVVLPLPLAAKAAAAEPEPEPDESAGLGKAIEELNRYVAGSRTDLRFAVDRDAGQLVVSIIDAESGQVLRQMPSLEALRIARYLEHDRLGLIRQRA